MQHPQSHRQPDTLCFAVLEGKDEWYSSTASAASCSTSACHVLGAPSLSEAAKISELRKVFQLRRCAILPHPDGYDHASSPACSASQVTYSLHHHSQHRSFHAKISPWAQPHSFPRKWMVHPATHPSLREETCFKTCLVNLMCDLPDLDVAPTTLLRRDDMSPSAILTVAFS
jgi:hypothetical protein